MGVHDRDYMKAGGGSRFAWAPGRITWIIIAINGVLWLIYSGAMNSARGRIGEDTLYGFVLQHFELWPEAVFAQGKVWQLATHFWLHAPGGASHVVFNMLALFFFGRTVESLLGPRRYLRLYLGAGLFAGLVFTGWMLLLDEPAHALGASGAVYAVLAWMACQYPRRTVYLMMIIPLPMWLAVGVLIIGLELFAFAGSGSGASAAHLAGALFGAGAWFLWQRSPARYGAPSRGWFRRKRPTPTAPGQSQRQGQGEREQFVRVRVEQLLAKISREGIGSLSPEEKAFLEEASRRYSDP